jgi:glycerophosphoryl diester phosphodiesterase
VTDTGIIIHGHRGSRGTHPENTLPSFEEARDAGAAFIELDVHLSKDGHAVVFHDFEISGKLCRDASGNPIADKIPVRELTLAELKSYDCGTNLLSAFPDQRACPGAKIPTLEEVIQWKLAQAPRLALNIEIKREKVAHAYRPAPELLAQGVIELLHRYELTRESLVQSFDFSVVRAARKLDSSVRLSCLFEEKADFAKMAMECDAQVAAPFHRLLDEENVARCQDAGLEVLPWTVNQPADWERLIGLGVTSIITDYPRKLVEFATVTVE